jgi:hypothetical protein
MSHHAFEIHVHGDVPLKLGVGMPQIEEALRPLWKYAGAKSLAMGARSHYEEEPGIKVNAVENVLSMCWTVEGNEDFRSALDEMCMGLNEIARTGAAIEVSFYDTEFDEEEADEDEDSRDDFVMLFVGPTPADIMHVQRDLLVEDVVSIMERHFEAHDLGGVVEQIDALFQKRFNDMVGALDIQRIIKGGGSGNGPSHGGGRKPRHLH